MILRHGNICLPPCLGRWRFESLEDLTAHFELLCSDPRDQAVAIAIKGMLTEARPSRMRWELLFEQRHVIGACFPAAETRQQISFLLGAELQDLYKPLLLDVGAPLWAIG